MSRTRTRFAPLFVLTPALMLAAGDAAAADRSAFDALADSEALAGVAERPFKSLCAESTVPGFRHCFAKIVTDENGLIAPAKTPQGLGAADLRSAYVLPTTGGNARIIAAVDAYDYPNAEADLAVYRTQYGLPACTTANGCFKKVDENGGTNLPGPDPAGGCTNGWSGETSLDLQMLSATCPDCHILLVEASAPDNSLQTAVNTAAKLGAVAISNSYGGSESPKGGDRASEASYTHPGILVTVSAGDSGFGAAYPATSAGVVAVGGTTLKKSASTRGWAETVWKGSGSGCSAEIAKPAWQTDATCKNRMEADVAAIADPATGVAVYCTDPGGAGGWGVVGGTSVAAPVIAGAFTVLGVSPDPSFAWKNPSLFFDVTTGSNGTCATPYYCTGETGYDGPTGWGTPNGALLAKSPTGGGTGGLDAGEAKDAEARDAALPEAGAGETIEAGSKSDDAGAGAVGTSPTLGEDSGVASGAGGSSAGGVGSTGGGYGASGSGSASPSSGAGPAPGGCAMTHPASGGGSATLVGLGLLLGLGARRRRTRG